MIKLRQISGVSENITAASKKSIKALHHLVFGEIGDRKNRSRLREFSGFEFADDSEEYQEKVIWTKTSLTHGDLTAICNILKLGYTGGKEMVVDRICKHLTDLELLKEALIET